MANIYLGGSTASNLYLGSQEICKVYLGSTQIYDGCGFTPVVVTLDVDNNITGPSAGYTIGGDLTGAQQSGQANVGTYAFNTTVNTNSGYQFTSGPSVSNASGTIPAANSTVTTTITGNVQLQATNKTVTLTVVDNVNNPGTSHTITGDTNGTAKAGLPGSTVTFVTNLVKNSEWTGTVNGSSASTVTVTQPVTVQNTNSTTTITFNGTLTQTTYTVTHSYNTSGVTGTQYSAPVSTVANANSSVVSQSGNSVTGYAGASWQFVTTGLSANSGYAWGSGDPTLSPTSPRSVSITGGQSSPTALTTNVAGTISQSSNSIQLSTSPGSCANGASIAYTNNFSSATLYYSGTLGAGTILYTDSGLQNVVSAPSGYYKNISNSTAIQWSGSAVLQANLVIQVNQLFSHSLGVSTTSGGDACSKFNANNKTTVYSNVSANPISGSYIFLSSDGCSASAGYVSDGTNFRQVQSSGQYTGTSQTCSLNKYYVDAASASSPNPCTDTANSKYYWEDPVSNSQGVTPGSEANTLAPNGTTVYANATTSTVFSGDNDFHAVDQPGTGDPHYQYISSLGVVGAATDCS